MDGCFRQTTKRTLKKQKITTAPLDPSQSSLARTRRRRPTPPEKKPSTCNTPVLIVLANHVFNR